jgi:hypothetical protein
MCCVREATAVEKRRSVKRVSAAPLLVVCLWFACPLILAVIPLAAQQTLPSAALQPSLQSQQLRADTQLQTGTESGLDTDARLLNLLADHEYSRVESQLDRMPSDQAQFYRGILANRSNDLEESVKLLEPLVDSVSRSGNTGVPADRSSSVGWNTGVPADRSSSVGWNTVHEKLLRKALAEDYLRLGEWAKAAQAYQLLDTRLKDKLTADEQDEIEMPLKLLPLAKDNPPTTVEPCDPFKLQVSENPLGLVDVPVFVDARSRNWMLDPTLPFNLIARSTAKGVGLKISGASAMITTLTGKPIQIRSAVIPRFTIGGRLTLRDMTAFVYDDKDYFFPQTSYQVEGVLGYPALAAMGSLTVTSDNTIFVRPAKQIAPPAPDDQLTTGARFYLDGDQVIVALGRVRHNVAQQSSGPAEQGTADGRSESSAGADDERMYAVDAGGQQTYLTSRYFDEHAAEFNNQKMEMFSLLGGQSPPQPAYTAEKVPLQVGSAIVTLHFIHVLTQPLGSAALDDVYGVLGADALGQLKSYTFDYRTMRFAVTAQ